ncbi:MAG: hypothetical protein IJY58_01965 [Alphaproteobacteria bacterium]|nr:hypothetical protein [Alphaproteobacteria bacterium]
MAISLEQLKEWGVPLVAPIGSVFANSDNNHTSNVRGSSLPSQDEIDESRYALNEEITKLNNYLERLTIVLGQTQTADTQAEHIRLLNNISAVNLPPEIKMVVAARYPQHVSNEVQKVTDKNKSNVDNPSSLAQQVAIMDVAARISSYNHTQYMLEVQAAFAEMDAARRAIHDEFMNSQGTPEDCQRFHKRAQQEREQEEKEQQARLANWGNMSEEEKMRHVMVNQHAIRSLEQEAEKLKQQIALEPDPKKRQKYEHRLQEVEKSSAQKKRFAKEYQEATNTKTETLDGSTVSIQKAINKKKTETREQRGNVKRLDVPARRSYEHETGWNNRESPKVEIHTTETEPRDTSVIDSLTARSYEQEAEKLEQQRAQETDPKKRQKLEHRHQELEQSSAQVKRFGDNFQKAMNEKTQTREPWGETALEHRLQEVEQSSAQTERFGTHYQEAMREQRGNLHIPDQQAMRSYEQETGWNNRESPKVEIHTTETDYPSQDRRKPAQTQTNVEAKASGNQRPTKQQKSGHRGSPLIGATPFEKGSSTDSDRQILEQRMANFRTLYEQASTPEQKKEYAVKLHRTQKEFTALSGQNHKNGTQNLTETPLSTLAGLAINAASTPSVQGDSNANTPATLAHDQSTPTGSLVGMDSLASAKPFSGEKQKPSETSEAQPNSPSNSSLIGKLALASAEQPSVPREFDITRLPLDNAPSIA